jgi:hypothetical protein
MSKRIEIHAHQIKVDTNGKVIIDNPELEEAMKSYTPPSASEGMSAQAAGPDKGEPAYANFGCPKPGPKDWVNFGCGTK